MFIYRHLTVTIINTNLRNVYIQTLNIINTNLRNVYIQTLNSHNNKYKFKECLYTYT